jgi:hypothetical protein
MDGVWIMAEKKVYEVLVVSMMAYATEEIGRYGGTYGADKGRSYAEGKVHRFNAKRAANEFAKETLDDVRQYDSAVYGKVVKKLY